MQQLSICLWFDNQAEEAVNFYTSVFKNSKKGQTSYYGDAGAEVSGQKKGSVMTITFEINGMKFMALQAGPMFKFTEAVSIVVNCDNQQEVDEYWAKLSEGGQELPCGWVKDKFGLSWQIVPVQMEKLMLNDKDPEQSERVMKAMLTMKKLDIKKLEEAANI